MSAIQLPTIQVIPYSVHAADYNMAADDYLLSLDAPVLRFYGWERPTLSFGKSNAKLDEIDVNVCRENDIVGVQRQTGGKTVLHHLELTYSFAANTDQFPRSILETYRLISQPLAESFAHFGLKTQMKEEKKMMANTTICFNETSSYELTAAGKKLVGSAQYRRRKRFVQHGAILLDIDWNLWKQIWRLPNDSRVLENRITSFQDQLDTIPGIEALSHQISLAFAKCFQTDLNPYTFQAEELEKIEALREKYRWEWE